MYRTLFFLLISASFLLSSSINAQTSSNIAILQEALDEGNEVLITLKSNRSFLGSIVSIDEESVKIDTEDGVFDLNYDRIKDVRIIDPSDRTSKWYHNPASNKLFVSQTGKMLDPGSGYYQNTIIFFSNVAYGISKNFSVDLGFSMIPGLGFENQLFSVGIKAGKSLNESFDISASLKYYRVFETDAGVTSLFSSATYSKNRLHLTAGAGLGLVEGESTNLLLILGGQFRISQRFALVTENFILPSSGTDSIPIISFGGRFISKKNAFDLGFFVPDDSGVTIPFVSYTIKF